MKMKSKTKAVAASVLFCGIAGAGSVYSQTIAASEASGLGGYIGLSGVYNEYEFSDAAGSEDDATGYRLNAGLLLGGGFSVDGRFEQVDGSFEGDDYDTSDNRVSVNYTTEMAQGFSVFAGLGYGFLNMTDEDNVPVFGSVETEVETDGFLLSLGMRFEQNSFFGTLGYTCLVAQSSERSVSGAAPGAGVTSLPDENIGMIEAVLGYQFTDHLAGTLSIEQQMKGNTLLEKNLGVAVGVQYKF